jgi:diacylglycerol O-acyltransferase / wax synthase
MDRLSPLDASFLYLESPRTHMHISSLAIYEGPVPSDWELRAMLERRLPLVPRFRQRLATVPFGSHRPAWIDDEGFDLDAHLQHVALAESNDEALTQLCGRILAQPLCRTRPLWEMWLITGLPKGRFAILSKTHHCLWDGIAGVDLHAVLLDDSPLGRIDDEPDAFEPRPEPSGLGMLLRAARDRVDEAVGIARGVVDAARDPAGAIRTATRFARDATTFASSLMRPAPPSALNERTGSRRRYATGRGSLLETKDLKVTLGVSVNDVVLAAVTGAIRQWQIHRHIQPHDVRVMVPVSVRTDADAPEGSPASGNRVAMVVVDLPVTDRTALMRLDRVHHAMQDAKASGHVAAGDAITRLSGFMPPAGIAAMSRAQAVMRPFNLVVTNIPGPQQPLYLLGRRLLELYPQAPLAANQGLSIAALSYDGKLGFGLLADHDSIPDVDVLARGLEASIDELCAVGSLDTLTPAEPSLSRLSELVSSP